MPESIRIVLESGLAQCSRCGQEHHQGQLEWRKFVMPVRVPDGQFEYWAACPTNGDPLLLRVRTSAKGVAVDD
jgi:hypothetical protein